MHGLKTRDGVALCQVRRTQNMNFDARTLVFSLVLRDCGTRTLLSWGYPRKAVMGKIIITYSGEGY